MVICMRRDLKMRRGKEIAQGGHAVAEWLKSRLGDGGTLVLNSTEWDWFFGMQTKICVQIVWDDIDTIMKRAHEHGVTVTTVVDAGYTEFGGKPTLTCLAVGPDLNTKVDLVTDDLRLY